MKKYLFTFCLALLATTSQATDHLYLVFTLTDGTTQSISATDLSLSFADGTLTAQSGTATLSLPLTQLTKMEFSTDAATALSTIEAEVSTGDDTEIYDLNGRRMPSGTQLPRGIYIVKSNGRTTKVQIR